MAREWKNVDTFAVWKDKYNELLNESIIGSFDLDSDLTTTNPDPQLVGWDLSTATYDGVSFGIGTEDGNPSGMYIKPDGTKLYMIGVSNDTIHQYTFSTPWDLSTLTYDNVAFTVNQDGQPNDVFFKDDGTKMYVVGKLGGLIHQYTLSTAWDISTALYDNVSFDVNNEEVEPLDMFIRPNGSKMYIIGDNSNSAHQYTLSTPWDLSTASFDGVSFGLSAQDIQNQGLFFKPDGSKMYVSGTSNDGISEYILSTPWDLSTTSFNVTLGVDTENQNATGISFKPDGTKMYMIGGSFSDDFVYQYTLPANTQEVTIEVVIKSGNIRLGSDVVNVSGDTFIVPVSDVNIIALYTDPQISELRMYQDGSVPVSFIIPLFKITTDSNSITSIDDLRTWADLSGSANDTDSGILTFNQNISFDKNIPAGRNALSIDPVVESGITVTVADGSTWVIL